MQLPRGFLGTEADVLIDIVAIALALIVPILWWSVREVRAGRFGAHRNIQLGLATFLLVVVVLFEIDLSTSGGIYKLTAGSRFAGTRILSGWLAFHLCFSTSTALLWTGLVGWSLWRIPSPPVPGPWSRVHRVVGRIAMIDMVLTGLTGIVLYILGFVL